MLRLSSNEWHCAQALNTRWPGRTASVKSMQSAASVSFEPPCDLAGCDRPFSALRTADGSVESPRLLAPGGLFPPICRPYYRALCLWLEIGA
jgi:hypothetical protein